MTRIAEIEAREKAATHLGFLALKAEQYARFPSIRKMSEDWHHIALIAANGYNSTAYLLTQLREAREKLEAEKEWREARHTCPVDYCCWSAALANRDHILKGGD